MNSGGSVGIIQPQLAPRQVEQIGDLAVVAEHLQRLLVVPLRLDRLAQRAAVARQREVRKAIRRLHDFRNRTASGLPRNSKKPWRPRCKCKCIPPR